MEKHKCGPFENLRGDTSAHEKTVLLASPLWLTVLLSAPFLSSQEASKSTDERTTSIITANLIALFIFTFLLIVFYFCKSIISAAQYRISVNILVSRLSPHCFKISSAARISCSFASAGVEAVILAAVQRLIM